MLRLVVCASAFASGSALQLPAAAHSSQVSSSSRCVNRRQAVSAATSFAALAALVLPHEALANTLPELDAPQSGFDDAAEKRKKFQEKQKIFKKNWRKQLSNLEFAQNDAEAKDAIQALTKLIYENGVEIPEGVRKMDLDQVYKSQKEKLAKDTRMEFGKLDALVMRIVTVKPMGEDLLGY